MIELFIAQKYILQKKKQSIVSILGIAIGLIVLMVSVGISNGLNKNMIDSILSITPHITALPYNHNIDNYKELQGQFDSIDGVKGSSPKIDIQGLLKYTEGETIYTRGVQLNGIDLEAASSKDIMNLSERILPGGEIRPDQVDGILLGSGIFEELQRYYNVDIGDKITVIVSEEQSVDFEITGAFKSGYQEFDRNFAIIPLLAAQALSGVGDSVEGIEIFVDDPHKADLISQGMRVKIPGYYYRTWGEANEALLNALTLERTVMIVLFSLIVVIAGFVVWIILNTLVREKTREIGVMRAMGFSSKNVMTVFLLQGIILGGAGILIGTSGSIGLLWLLKNHTLHGISQIYYNITTIPVELSFQEGFTIIMANFIVIVLSSIFPAYTASKLRPVEALRYE